MERPTDTDTTAIDAPAEEAFTPSKALTFKMLALLWIFPSITSLFIIGFRIPQSGDFMTFLHAVRLEQWVSLGLLLVHPVLIVLAIRYRRMEQSQSSGGAPKTASTEKNLY